MGGIKILKLINKFFKEEEEQSLNEFLNVKNIKENILYTLDGQVAQFIKVEPINIELLTDEELESKMNFSSIEFSEEQQPYKILVIPRAVDISEHIEEQEELKRKIDDDVGIEIINNRIISTTEIVENKNIIENEFYIMIYDSNKDNIENELMKRANNWINRLKNCGYRSSLLYEREIILLIKSFTIPEFARSEGTDYADNIVQIKGKEINVKNK
ncbi:MAG: hypothetical protein IJH12_03590 [Clostridia bacterium]|nr:hypothetical protein [Clostridia bacterium]